MPCEQGATGFWDAYADVVSWSEKATADIRLFFGVLPALQVSKTIPPTETTTITQQFRPARRCAERNLLGNKLTRLRDRYVSIVIRVHTCLSPVGCRAPPSLSPSPFAAGGRAAFILVHQRLDRWGNLFIQPGWRRPTSLMKFVRHNIYTSFGRPIGTIWSIRLTYPEHMPRRSFLKRLHSHVSESARLIRF